MIDATARTTAITTQRLPTRKSPSDALTSVSPIFSSTGTRLTVPTDGSQHLPAASNVSAPVHRSLRHEKGRRKPLYLPSSSPVTAIATACAAIRAPEYQTPFSCLPVSSPAISLCAVRAKPFFVATREFSICVAALPRIPRYGDPGMAAVLPPRAPCSCGRFSPEYRRPDNISGRTTAAETKHCPHLVNHPSSSTTHGSFLAVRSAPTPAFPRQKTSHSRKHAPPPPAANFLQGISLLYIPD